MNNQTELQIIGIMNTVKDLGAASAVLGWDQETYMPDGAGEARAEQIATLDTLAHQHLTSDISKKLAADVRGMNGEATSLLKLFVKDHDRAAKLPEELVRETSKAQSLAQEAWKRAKGEKNFSIFAPHLQKLIDLKIQAAELYGYEKDRYDALLDLFEPGMTVAQLDPVFKELADGTRDLLKRIEPNLKNADNSILSAGFDKEKQIEFSRFIAEKLGYDFNHGRLDLTAHPFCTTFAITDVRITTRVFENDLRSCLFGVIHETGHALYEQGIDKKYARTFAADGTSMGIHESQSLFWENMVARTEEFWTWALPHLRARFPEQLRDMTPRAFFKAINTIQPSFIRVEADEVTYNMHIILRYHLERDLINGRLKVEDVPKVWAETMQEFLGITPENDAVGSLQDVHWSFGGFGYFPSYTLGKLYAAMIWNQLEKEMPDVREQISKGEFLNIRVWLRENIHQYGRTQEPIEIIKRVTGRTLTARDFLEYVNTKATNVYEL
ncbi:MAG TPA: carboxypeptidase M32 [Patescibacteria group bacterium]|nr:carboxypeptidase M32 [Patescibacteria group bacterium]